mgnify:CR=1 FL=1
MVDHQENGVLAFAPGGDRIVDRYGTAQGQAPAGLAQPQFPCFVDGFDEHVYGATAMLKAELTRHGGTTGRKSRRLPIHANISEL